MARAVRSLFASVFSMMMSVAPIVAQQEAPSTNPATSTSPQKLSKEQKKKMGRALKELDAQYKQWLNEDVIYIIAPEERTAFLQLSTSEEREQFIEQFWLRRSSNPDLPANDSQEEHYRRIAYATEHYASGVPGAGLSVMESMGMASKADRFTRSDGTNLPTTMGGQPASMNEFNRLEQFAKVQQAPAVKFKDLEALVKSRIVRDQVHFAWRTDFLKVTNDTVLVPVTVQVPNSQLSFQSKDGVHSATLNVFGRVSTLTGRVVQTFEEPVSRDFPDSLFQQSVKLQSIYQKAVPLRPGLYRLDLVIKDVQSGNIGVVNTRLQVPRYEDEKLEASSLIIADQIEHVPAKQIGSGQFVLGSSKVRPRLEGDFTTADRLGIYLQIYNLKPDDKTHKSSGTFQFTVKKGKEQIMQFKETSEEMKQTGDQVTIERLLPLATLSPGKYSLEVNAIDSLSNQTISKTADFTVKAVPETKTAAVATPGRYSKVKQERLR